MAQKIVLPRSRFNAMSKEVVRSLLVNFAAKLAEMGDMKTAQHLLNLDPQGWRAFTIALLETSRAIVFEQQKFEMQVKLTEARIQRGLSRQELAAKLQALDKSVRIEATNIAHLETEGQARKEMPPAWKAAFAKFFGVPWEQLAAPISNE